jgi:hypothetical protein
LLASKGEEGHKPTFDVTNVNAHSLGIQGTDPETGRKRNKILIPRNTPLPAEVTKACVIKKDGQENVVVKVLEGESLDPKECTAIGSAVIRDLPLNLKKGWPIDVTYEYQVNGRLHVRAKVRGTDKEVEMELERDEAMSADRLTRWKNVLAADGGLDAFDAAIMDELNELKKHAPKPPKPAPTPAGSQATAPASPIPTTPAPAGRTTRSGGTPQPATPSTPQPAPVTPIPMTPIPMTPAPAPTPAAAPAPAPTVAFTCPHCRGVFHAPASLAGQQVNCPGCRGPLIVPNVRRS